MVSGALIPLPLDALADVLRFRLREKNRRDYLIQLVWLAGAQLFALGGGKDYPMPELFTLFPDAAASADRRSAQAIRREVLTRVKASTGKEEHHGQAV